jgi:hypothetical protein
VARRRVNTTYPEPPIIGRTIEDQKTSLDGARRFLASENVVVYADHKVGLGRAAGELWMLPSASRGLGNYLDLNQRAGLAGFRLQRDPRVTSLPGTTPASLLDHFREVADATKRHVVDNDRKLKLHTCSYEPDDPWPWHGMLSYEHVYALAGGERTLNEAHIQLRAREAVNGEVDIAVVVQRPNEYEAAKTWLHSGCQPGNHSWLVSSVGLPTEPADRGEALVNLLDGFSVGETLRVSNPDVHPRERTVGEAEPEERNPFLELMKQAPYRTKMGGLDVMLDRVEADDGILGGLTVYLWRRGGAAGSVVALHLRHRPVQDDHVELRWNGARRLPNTDRPDLDDEFWGKLPAVDWDEDQKTKYTLQAWGDVVSVLFGDAAAASNQRESA